MNRNDPTAKRLVWVGGLAVASGLVLCPLVCSLLERQTDVGFCAVLIAVGLMAGMYGVIRLQGWAG